jgi:hypothetical protein
MQAFTVSAAARLCGVDRRTLQRAIQAGRLPLDAQHCLSREALIAAGYLDATLPQDTSQDMPQFMPQETSQELGPATTLLALLERLTTAITNLHEEVRSLRDDLRQMPQRTPHGRRRDAPTAPQAAPQETPHAAAPVPQGTPHDTPQVIPATPARPHGLPAQTLQAIAETAAQYDKLTLTELSQLLYDRQIYRTRDRHTGEEKPVQRGTLKKWLDQARRAGVL